MAVLGDLHLEPDQMRLFHKARKQVVSRLSHTATGQPLPCAAVVQLGDVGGYNNQPGGLCSSASKCISTTNPHLLEQFVTGLLPACKLP